MSKVYSIGKFRFTVQEIFIILAIIMILASKAGYPKHASAKDVLAINGMTTTETFRGGFFSCGAGMDFYRTGFKAVDKRGIKVEGTVCEGLLSDPYIRVKSYVVNLGG